MNIKPGISIGGGADLRLSPVAFESFTRGRKSQTTSLKLQKKFEKCICSKMHFFHKIHDVSLGPNVMSEVYWDPLDGHRGCCLDRRHPLCPSLGTSVRQSKSDCMSKDTFLL